MGGKESANAVRKKSFCVDESLSCKPFFLDVWKACTLIGWLADLVKRASRENKWHPSSPVNRGKIEMIAWGWWLGLGL